MQCIRNVCLVLVVVACITASPLVSKPRHPIIKLTLEDVRPMDSGNLQQVVMKEAALAAIAEKLNTGAMGLPIIKVDPGNANNYVDMVLANLNKLMPERVDLPDVGTPANLHECYMFGLDGGLARSGDATMVTVDRTVKFNAEIKTMAEVGLECRWRILLLGGKASGSTEVISISMSITVHLSHGTSPALTEFRVLEVAPIKTQITGLTWLFNWLVELIANLIIGVFQDQMIVVIESVIKELLQGVLGSIVIP